jgi:hypothetical protein
MPEESPEDSQRRHFNYVSADGTVSGRYSGKKPKQAANKVYSALWRGKKSEGKAVTGKIKFAIRECTRGSKHKTYYYVGVRDKLDTPTKVPIQSGGGETKIVKYYYSNNVMKDRDTTLAENAKATKAKEKANKEKKATKSKKAKAAGGSKKATSSKAKSSKAKSTTGKSKKATTSKKATSSKKPTSKKATSKKATGGKKEAK